MKKPLNKLEINNLTFKNKNDNYIILKNLNLNLNSDKVLFLLGSSGQGKSSLLKTILKQTDIISGTILFNNQNIFQLNKKDWKSFLKEVSYLNQTTTSIPFETVFTNITRSIQEYKNVVFNLFNLATKSQKEEIISILKELNILDKIYHRVDSLSGGQQQRVEIAKLMIQKPKIILADEPTNFLDPETSKNIIELLIKMAKKFNSILIIVTHNTNLVEQFDSSILLIKNQEYHFYESNKQMNSTILEQVFKND
ncbi:ATP-binding cassette domain-containing protein [Mycoplasma sp. 1654_15]|uniref:ATP-binding cassette domain-containing protein n=1 Tax=Mycoplasma sp. 1654_15 TaxID=2725994 RepID=UPI001449D028|nr:ATP-binding cassette domain-containing protein [Mycoplasma sp. 1654_15]QJB70977.1 ATP-binding cassette domain-containing protein [Mycoplasma sp. 1654_15]